jgi:hypothetical protein
MAHDPEKITRTHLPAIYACHKTPLFDQSGRRFLFGRFPNWVMGTFNRSIKTPQDFYGSPILKIKQLKQLQNHDPRAVILKDKQYISRP